MKEKRLSTSVTREMMKDIQAAMKERHLNMGQYIDAVVRIESMCYELHSPIPGVDNLFMVNRNKKLYPGKKPEYISAPVADEVYDIVRHASDVTGMSIANILRDMIAANMLRQNGEKRDWFRIIMDNMHELMQIGTGSRPIDKKVLRLKRNQLAKDIEKASSHHFISPEQTDIFYRLYIEICKKIGIRATGLVLNHAGMAIAK